jgi:hypothetical protein
LALEVEKLGAEESQPKSELGKNLRELEKFSKAETTAENDVVLMYKLFPVMKAFREQIVESIRKKESRMHELERERSSLAGKSTYVTYAAISLQIFGVMFILAKDIAKETQYKTPRASRSHGRDENA